MSQNLNTSKKWWQGATIYEIYIRSFKDSNGDGIGDLQGIVSELPYLASLNIDAIWITPFFKSPMKDFGYDVADYCSVDPVFGNMEDFDELLEKAHNLGLKVIIDQVWSHTSDQHPWFMESAKDKTNPKADWYVWKDGNEKGEAPNNWLSIFGGSAWKWHEGRKQFYLHNFLESQPDLNWHNEEMVSAVMEAADFWLSKGVDGFRLDVCNFYLHDENFADNPLRTPGMPPQHGVSPLNPYSTQIPMNSINRNGNIRSIRRIREKIDEFDNRMIMGEIAAVEDCAVTSSNYIRGNRRFHTAYNSSLLVNDPLTPELIANSMRDLELCLEDDEMTSFAMSTHDFTRAFSKWRPTNHRYLQNFERCLIALLPSMKGIACFYQGEELGLTETEVALEDIQDPFGKHFAEYFSGRDGCRTPIPWDSDSKYFGFSTSAPWLPVNPEYKERAVAVLNQDRESILNFYRDFLKFRRTCSELKLGTVRNIHHDEQLLSFCRDLDGSSLTCMFNLSESKRSDIVENGAILYSNGIAESSKDGEMQIGFEPFGFAILKSKV